MKMIFPLPLEHHYEVKRLTHWWRVYFGDSEKPSVLLISASKQYLDDLLKCDSTQENLDDWVNGVADKWQSENVITEPVYYLVFANSLEGEKNGMHFLMNEITP